MLLAPCAFDLWIFFRTSLLRNHPASCSDAQPSKTAKAGAASSPLVPAHLPRLGIFPRDIHRVVAMAGWHGRTEVAPPCAMFAGWARCCWHLAPLISGSSSELHYSGIIRHLHGCPAFENREGWGSLLTSGSGSSPTPSRTSTKRTPRDSNAAAGLHAHRGSRDEKNSYRGT